MAYTLMHAASPTISFQDATKGWIEWGSVLGEFRLTHTIDGGHSWQAVPGVFPPGIVFLDDSHWYAVEDGTFLRTDDAGSTWRETQLPRRGSISRLQFLSLTTGWIATIEGNEIFMLRTTDRGDTWKESRIAGSDPTVSVEDVSFLNPSRGTLVQNRLDVRLSKRKALL
jgi:photosystem II stability/assembly factor-like uncharacterized protein